MRMSNGTGTIYYNIVEKRGKLRYIVKGIDGTTIRGRDKGRTKSRTFTQQHQAEAWLKRNGYEPDYSPWEN